MKTLSSNIIDSIEIHANPKGTWVILAESYGKFRPVERITFYEYEDKYFCVIDRMGYRGKTLGYQYDNREEGNLHFNRMKIETAIIGNLFKKDCNSFEK